MEREFGELLARFEAPEKSPGGVDAFEGDARAALGSDAVVTKNRLALLAGEVEKLQNRHIDGVDVTMLDSGKEEARSERKDLNRRADALHAGVMDLHRRCVDRIHWVQTGAVVC